MRGYGMDEKKCMVVELFKERKLDILALSDTRWKVVTRENGRGKLIVYGVSERVEQERG